MNKSGKILGGLAAAAVLFLLADSTFASSRFHFSVGSGWGGHSYRHHGFQHGRHGYHRPSYSHNSYYPSHRPGVSFNFSFGRPSYYTPSYHAPRYVSYPSYTPSYYGSSYYRPSYNYGYTYFSQPRVIYAPPPPVYYRPPVYSHRPVYHHPPVIVRTYPSHHCW